MKYRLTISLTPQEHPQTLRSYAISQDVEFADTTRWPFRVAGSDDISGVGATPLEAIEDYLSWFIKFAKATPRKTP